MKKTNSNKLTLRTQTVAALSANDLRKAGGATASLVGLTTQLTNGGWTTIMSNAGWTTIII